MTPNWNQLTPSYPHRLADSRHVLLTTYEPDGTPRQHTCRVIADGPALGIVLSTRSPEADRIRRCRGVLVATCDANGVPTGPEWPAKATICAAERTVDYRMALINKYGLLIMFALAVRRLRRGLDGTTGVRLTPTGQNWPLVSPTWLPTTTYSPN